MEAARETNALEQQPEKKADEVMNAAPHPRGARSAGSGRYPGWRKRRFPFPDEWFLAQWLHADAALRVDIEAGSAAPNSVFGHRISLTVAGAAQVGPTQKAGTLFPV